jgi:pre-60S factor REI1
MKASNYQCVNCQISFGIEGDYISHYKSEHHRYNIKRKLIGLPPVTFQ